MAPPADNPRRRSRARSWPTSSACPRPRPRPTRPRRQSCRPGAAPCPRPRGWPSRPMPIDRRLLFNIDWGMMAAVLLLLGIGVATILSATYSGRSSGLEVKQVYWILIGLVALLVCVSIDYRRLVDHAPLLYLASVAVLAYVLFLGPRIAGTRRWIVMGPMQLQPSEFVKLVAALFVAKIFAESKKDSLGIRDILGPGAAVGLLAALIAAEPDLGTAFTLVPLFVVGSVLAGLRLKAVLVLLAVAIVV